MTFLVFFCEPLIKVPINNGCKYLVCNVIEKCVEDIVGNGRCVPNVPDTAGCDTIICTTNNTECVEDTYGNGMCVAITSTGCDAIICNGKSKCVEKLNGKSVCVCNKKNFKYVDGKCVKRY
jgi:hypothetical protein